jgi:hypothetical protein
MELEIKLQHLHFEWKPRVIRRLGCIYSLVPPELLPPHAVRSTSNTTVQGTQIRVKAAFAVLSIRLNREEEEEEQQEEEEERAGEEEGIAEAEGSEIIPQRRMLKSAPAIIVSNGSTTFTMTSSTFTVAGHCAVQLQDGNADWVRARIEGLRCEQHNNTLRVACTAVQCNECSLKDAPSTHVSIQLSECSFDELTGSEAAGLAIMFDSLETATWVLQLVRGVSERVVASATQLGKSSGGKAEADAVGGGGGSSSLLAIKKIRVAVVSPEISARADGVSGDIKGAVELGSMSLVGFGMDARLTSAQIATTSNGCVTLRCQVLSLGYIRQIGPEPTTYELPVTLSMPLEFQCAKMHLSYKLSSTTLHFTVDGFQFAAVASCINANHTALRWSAISIKSDEGWVEAMSIGVEVLYTGNIRRFEQLVVSVGGAEIQIMQQNTFETLVGVSDELSSGGDSCGYHLPHAHISPTHLLLSISNISYMKAKTGVAVKELNLNRKHFDFVPFNGTEGTTSNDVLSHYLQVTKSVKGLFLFFEALGPGRMAAQGIGGVISLASGTHVGRVVGSGMVVGGVVAGAAFDAVGQVVSKGKMVRSASSVSNEDQSDSYQFGDFTRGIAAAVVDTAKTGGGDSGGDSGGNSGGNSRGGYQLGDFTRGALSSMVGRTPERKPGEEERRPSKRGQKSAFGLW